MGCQSARNDFVPILRLCWGHDLHCDRRFLKRFLTPLCRDDDLFDRRLGGRLIGQDAARWSGNRSSDWKGDLMLDAAFR